MMKVYKSALRQPGDISAIILGAGQSRRMGQPKLLLPWGETSVLGHILTTLRQAGIEDILVVTGGAREQVEAVCAQFRTRTTHNTAFAQGEMLSSMQCGLRAQNTAVQATLLCLGDQPQVRGGSVQFIVEAYMKSQASLIVPSFQMRRGHPWLVTRTLWDDLLGLNPPQSPRDFLNAHAAEIEYVNLETPDILQDLDTPADYLKSKP